MTTDTTKRSPDTSPSIRTLDADGYRAAIPGLSALIVDAVEGGASVNFLYGVTVADAAAWWRARIDDVAHGVTTPFVALDDEQIVGSLLLIRSTNPNSPHRAEVAKVIVHRRARRRGLASAIMAAAEDMARTEGRWLLFLDTVTRSPAAAFYERLGWQEAGTIPYYALLPDGEPAPATFYWKDLR